MLCSARLARHLVIPTLTASASAGQPVAVVAVVVECSAHCI